MKQNRKKKPELSAKKSQKQFLLETMQRFIDTQVASLPFQTENTLRNASEFSRSFIFSRKITGKNDRPLITNTFHFLEYLHGDKFETSQLPGYRDSMVYWYPGWPGAMQQSFQSWLVNNMLSLTTHRLLQSFHIWLSQVSTAQLLTYVERSTSLAATPTLSLRIREEVLTYLRSGKLAEREMQALLPVVESVQQRLFHERAAAPTIQYETLNQFLNSPDSLSRIFVLPSQPGGPESVGQRPEAVGSEKVLKAPQPRFLFESEFERTQKTWQGITGVAQRSHPVWKMAEYLEFVYTRLPLSAGHGTETVTGDSSSPGYTPQTSLALVSPSAEGEIGLSSQPGQEQKTGLRYLIASGLRRLSSQPGLEQTLPENRLVHLQWPAALRSIEQWVEEKQQADPAFRAAPPAPDHYPWSVLLQKTQQVDDQVIDEKTLRLLLNRQLVKSSALSRENDEGDRGEQFLEEFTFLRKTETARSAQQSYAYARPLYPVKAEESVTKTQRRKEVLEIVQKEIDTAMNAGSIIDNLTRADLSHLADQVYSSLTRKLLMEKERLGLGS